MGHCGSTLKHTEVNIIPEGSAASSVETAKKRTKEGLTNTANPALYSERKLPAYEGVGSLDLPHTVNLPTEHDLLIDELNLKIKQQRAIMHEGRNVRAASLGHLQAAMEAMKHGMDELRALLATKPPEVIAVKLQTSLAHMERAYHLQHLSQAGELYTSIIENYLLSPEDKEEFALIAWVNSMIDMLSSEALVPIRKAGLLGLSTEYIVHGHKAVLLYSLVNLMQNAIKFTKPKLTASSSMPLDITVSLTEEEGSLWFSVVDKGIGMDEGQTARCLDGSHKRFTLVQGSGSGLSAVHSALTKVGGAIHVTSTKDVGTRFNLTLPLTLINKTTAPIDYSKLSVLVADDGLVNLKLARQLLRSLGVPLTNIFIVGSKKDAFTVFTRQHSLNRPISLILTDLNMGGGLDGFELAQEVRNFEAAHSFDLHTHVVVVSGTICTAEKGFELTDGQLLKPISKDDLALHLSKVAASPSALPKSYVSEAATPSAAGAGMLR